MKVFYDKVFEYVDLIGEEMVIDVYCGIGIILLFFV